MYTYTCVKNNTKQHNVQCVLNDLNKKFCYKVSVGIQKIKVMVTDIINIRRPTVLLHHIWSPDGCVCAYDW